MQQEQPENNELVDQQEIAPDASDAPSPVEHSADAGEEAAQQEPAGETAAGDQPADQADSAESAAQETAEQPDGAVTADPEDQGADASQVDPQIDLGLLEAYLFSTHSPLTPGRLAELFNLESTKPIRKAIRLLNEQYEQTGRCFRVEQVAGGFQLLTLPEYGEHLKALHQKEADAKLTKAALETLSIIAYKQPILRADIEAIRGVASGETIRSLMEKHLVKIAGRAEEPGRPILYGTTKRFLEVFGLNSLKDLPQPESQQQQAKARQLSKLLREEESPEQQQEKAQASTNQEQEPAEQQTDSKEASAEQATEPATTDPAQAAEEMQDQQTPPAPSEQQQVEPEQTAPEESPTEEPDGPVDSETTDPETRPD